MTYSILMYGRDPLLIETRRLVLERRGHRVVSTCNTADIAPSLETGSFDLFLLCHSLTTNECDRALEMARTQWPSVKRLVLTSGSLGCRDHEPSNIFDTTFGPEKLLSTVANLIQLDSPQLSSPA